MGILAQTSNYQNCNKKNKVIPDYARDFRNEYLFIKGINKACGKFLKRLEREGKVFNTSKAKKLIFYFKNFLKAREVGYLKDTSKFYFKESDFNYIVTLEINLDYYMDIFVNPHSFNPFAPEPPVTGRADPGPFYPL